MAGYAIIAVDLKNSNNPDRDALTGANNARARLMPNRMAPPFSIPTNWIPCTGRTPPKPW